MNSIRCLTTALVLAGIATTCGCQSKQEAPPAKSVAPAQDAGAKKTMQDAAAIKSMSGQVAGGRAAISAADRADAEAAAARVLGQMEGGEFSALYREASPGFKKIGSEAAFVEKFQQTHQKTGPLQGPKLTSFAPGPDRTHVLVYRLQNERFKTERRLTFARSQGGKMELFGLNQHDEARVRPVK